MTNINLPGEAESERAYLGSPALRIRELNDRFRAYIKSTGYHQGAGLLLVTRGVAARGDDFVTRAIDATCAFGDFTDDNDPYREHDFGNFELDGETVFWKIDLYEAGEVKPLGPTLRTTPMPTCCSATQRRQGPGCYLSSS